MNVDLTHRILDALGKPRSLIKPVADRPGHDRRYCLDTTKLRGLGWAPQVPFEAGLRDTVDWYRQNEWWWRPIKESDPAFKAYYQAQYEKRLSRQRARGPVLDHRCDRLCRRAISSSISPARIELVGWGRSAPRPEIAGLARVAARRSARSRAACDSAIASLRPAAVFHLAGAPQVAESWRDTHQAARRQRPGHRITCSTRSGVPELSCRVLVTGSARSTRPPTTPITEEATARARQSVRAQQARAGTAGVRAFAEDGLDRDRHGPFNHTGPRQTAGVRRAKHGAADRADRDAATPSR